MRGICRALIVTAVVACSAGFASAQSAVGNAGFEADLVYDQPVAAGNWTAFFGGPANAVLDAAKNTTAPHSGAAALHLKVAVAGMAFCGVQQPISGIQPGVTYALTHFARKAGNVLNGVEYRIEWKNASGGFIGDQFGLNTRIDSQLTNTYQQFTLTAVAPAGAANANLVFAAQSFATNPLDPGFDTEAYIDDVTFAAVSLPTQGACCLTDGTCQVAVTGSCPVGSSSQAPGTTCSPNNCPPPATPGACCNNSTGSCTLTFGTICTPIGGNFRGDGTSCTPNPCTVAPVCRADFNGSGAVTVQDIFDFLSAYFTGCP